MKRYWSDDEMQVVWRIWPDEEQLLQSKTGASKLGCALLLKYFQYLGRFPSNLTEIPSVVVKFIAIQIGVKRKGGLKYSLKGRTAEHHRANIRTFCGFRKASMVDGQKLEDWLVKDILNHEYKPERVHEAALGFFLEHRLDPPGPERMKRLLVNAMNRWESMFCASIFQQLSSATINGLENLLQPSPNNETDRTIWQDLKLDPGKAGLESVKKTVIKLQLVRSFSLPVDLFKNVSPKLLEKHVIQATAEEPHELRRHGQPLKITLLAAFIHRRCEDLIDHLLDLAVEIIHKMNKKAETKIEIGLEKALQKAPHKIAKLYRIAKAVMENPAGVVSDVVFPAAPEKWLLAFIAEMENKGQKYKGEIRNALFRSYQGHYRRILPFLLNNLEFRCTNPQHQPVIKALGAIKAAFPKSGRTFPTGTIAPLDGIVTPTWRPLVIEEENDIPTINRTAYEICVLNILRERLRCREIWVVNSRRYRDPEADLPQDFKDRREFYYAELGIPLDVNGFIQTVQKELEQTLMTLNRELPTNPKVKIVTGKDGSKISISPFQALPDPENIALLKQEINRRWTGTNLLDALKETDLRVNFTQTLRSGTDRSHMDKVTLRRRLLLCLFGLGTNAGIKSVETLPLDEYKDLLYVRRRFISIERLRRAIVEVINATLQIRDLQIWGEATTACGADSKQFGAWDENLLTEWHMRYGGRGIMVYWHVEKNAVCIYSQLKRVSSSEVGAMINGVLQHCTEMEVDRQYVDSHGQSTIAFAFCRLLGFDLMPRLKAIAEQKLCLPQVRMILPNLEGITTTKGIDWKQIEEQFDVIIKHAVALKLGMADAESLLRRFTRKNAQHPAYKALIEFGKAIKTMFLCRYLSSEDLRREINAGLNVVETWNSTSDFIFFGERGELATNRKEDQEIGLLSLHLLQSSLVFINTLMIQNVLREPEWAKRMTARDLSALSPLMTQHIKKYGRFELDLEKRLELESSEQMSL